MGKKTWGEANCSRVKDPKRRKECIDWKETKERENKKRYSKPIPEAEMTKEILEKEQEILIRKNLEYKEIMTCGKLCLA